MANIKFELDYTPIDGASITIKTPCDCTTVNGLAITYPRLADGETVTSETVFTFKDAHGNDLSELGELFGADAYIKFILDTTNHIAYPQNADTNSYLEGKFETLTNHTTNKSNPHGVTASQISAVPTSRTVNGKALSSNISLGAGDVGALPTSGGTISGDLTVNGSITTKGTFNVGLPTGGSSLELFHQSTPYIDFHHGGTTTDYTSRIIENASGRLSINGVNCISGGIVAAGKFRMNDGWVGMYPSANDATNNTNRYGYLGYDNGTMLNIYDGKSGIWIRSAGPTKIGTADAYKVGLYDAGAAWRPEANGDVTLGSANYKWGQIYSSKSSINTSDRSEKENIKDIDEKYIQLFDKLQPVSYEFIGDGHDRIHVGYIAQDVKEAMDEVGLTDLDFAGYCRDIKIVPTFDENGNVIDEKEAVDENGNQEYIYSLRYGEFIALNTKMIQMNRAKIAEQQKEIDELKKAVAELTAKVNS